MALIRLQEYCKKWGVEETNISASCRRGTIKTAQKIGYQWFIEADEEPTDTRVKGGNYVGVSAKNREALKKRLLAEIEAEKNQAEDNP